MSRYPATARSCRVSPARGRPRPSPVPGTGKRRPGARRGARGTPPCQAVPLPSVWPPGRRPPCPPAQTRRLPRHAGIMRSLCQIPPGPTGRAGHTGYSPQGGLVSAACSLIDAPCQGVVREDECDRAADPAFGPRSRFLPAGVAARCVQRGRPHIRGQGDGGDDPHGVVGVAGESATFCTASAISWEPAPMTQIGLIGSGATRPVMQHGCRMDRCGGGSGTSQGPAGSLSKRPPGVSCLVAWPPARKEMTNDR
jgi:hypothetical protein